MTRFGTVEYEVAAHVARITMDRPEKRNALNDELLDGIDAAFVEAERDPDVHAVVLAGNGPSFCAGYDLGGSRYATAPEGGWDLGNTVGTLRTIEAGYQRDLELPEADDRQGPGPRPGRRVLPAAAVRHLGRRHRRPARAPGGQDGRAEQHAAVAGRPAAEGGPLPAADRAHRRRHDGRRSSGSSAWPSPPRTSTPPSTRSPPRSPPCRRCPSSSTRRC